MSTTLALLLPLLAVAQEPLEAPVDSRDADASTPETGSPEKDAADTLELPSRSIARRPESAAEVMAFFDVDESLLRQLVDYRPLAAEEEEAVIRVLFALPNIPAQDIQRWSQKDADWDAVIAAPDEFRTQIYQLRGYVTRVERVPLIAEAAQRFGLRHYYRAEAELGEDGWKAIICTRNVPKAWKIGEPINEAFSCHGMFLKLGDRPVFATRRLAWHPNRLDEAAGITKDHVFLGDLGMDVGLWDDVRDQQAVLWNDRECFYQLLAALGRTNQEHMRLRSTDEYEIADLHRRPRDFHGRILTIDGIARRATRVEVSDPDVQARFGIDHYYEVDVIVYLDKALVHTTPDGRKLQYRRFPVVCNVRELPPGMPQGDDIRQRVRIPAVFFKIWAYDAKKADDFKEGMRQHSPMLVGVAPDLYRTEPPYSPYLGVMVGCAFIVALLGVWIGVWRYEGDIVKRPHLLEPGKSLNDMGLEDKGEPDFRHLG